MRSDDIPAIIAAELGVKPWQTAATIKLLDEDNTIPFIARYRKEVTGELNEEQLRNIAERLDYLRNLAKRQNEILASIREQDKLTPELEQAILQATRLQELEDLYLPYRPKKRTRASIAKEKGLEPLAEMFLAQTEVSGDVSEIATAYVNSELGVQAPEEAIAGAQDIIAEKVSETPSVRALVRQLLWDYGELAAELDEEAAEAKEFLMYKDYVEQINKIPPHRVLAINRGESRECLKVKLNAPHDKITSAIETEILTRDSIFTPYIKAAIQDGYKRLLLPSLERELRAEITETAEKQAIKVFALNLRQLLLQPPYLGQVVAGLDPGYRTGCKMAVVNELGRVLETGTLYITGSEAQVAKAREQLLQAISTHHVTLIAIGNGTASYETEEFVAALIQENNLSVLYTIVNEAGASVYSASKLAKEELPDLDVSLRGAVSIARRIQDPLAELVKIDPKSIGVGQYQHDVNQRTLGETLESVVESCVNHVGVELNTASPALLSYVAGISGAVAKNIVAYRETNGPFSSRAELLKVSRLGPATFTQCAGFLRIVRAVNPLDNTPVHPESYALAEQILAALGFSLNDLNDKEKFTHLRAAIKATDPAALASQLSAGVPTVKDILDALAKPGRDPREELPLPLTRKNLVKLSDLEKGTVLKGTVRNVVDFGAFVDIGLKVCGLVHRSELSNRRFKHPLDVVAVGDIVDVMVLDVDEARERIALSIRQVSCNVSKSS